MEQLAVRTSADQEQVCLRRLVDQKPVRADVAFAATGVIANQNMIAELGFKGLSTCQSLDDSEQLFLVPVRRFELLQVLFEATLKNNVKHHERGL